MNEFMMYGFGALIICFVVSLIVLHRVPTDVFSEDYEFRADPFWYVIGLMFLGGSAAYFAFPVMPDMVHAFTYTHILVPFLLAVILYFCYLFDIAWLTNLVTLGAALGVSYLQPDDFQLFPDYLTDFQDKLAVALLLFLISKGMGLLNGIAALGSLQFLTLMISIVLLTHFGGVPQILGVIAFAYFGVMMAFLLFSWPPERLFLSHGAFASFGFIMGCLMLNSATEFADASMFIATSYIFTEMGVALYNRFIMWQKRDFLYMNTAYYTTFQKIGYPDPVIRGIIKILLIDIVLSLMQIMASERLALSIFSVLLNLWFLSILSGNTNPDDLFSLTKFGRKVLFGLFSKKETDKKSKKKKKKA